MKSCRQWAVASFALVLLAAGPALAVPVYVDDLGVRVIRGYQDPSPGKVRFANKDISAEAIVLAFYLKPGQNISELGKAVDEMLATASDTFLPKDIRVEKISNKPEMVDEKIAAVVDNLIDSVLIVLAVLVLLSGPRVATVCALAIPMIMLIAVGAMRFWDCAIEQISLAALIIALGMLVDNAIQVCDNTNRFLREGLDPDEAAVKGPNQIGFPILIATLSILAAFIPMTFCLTGGSKEYVFSLPVVISLALVPLKWPGTGRGWLAFWGSSGLYVVATFTLFKAVSLAGPLRTAIIDNTSPVWATLFGFLLLGQVLSVKQLGGILVVVAAVIALQVSATGKQADPGRIY